MRFLPREEKFYGLFLDQVKLISEAATLLTRALSGSASSLPEAAERISQLERQADEKLHEIFQRLNHTFITPLDPEDIHSLSTRLDDVIDGLEELAHRIAVYKIDPLPPVAVEVSRHISSSVQALERAFVALRDDTQLLEHCIEINRIEELVDGLIRKAIVELFDAETDPIRILKLKEIYELLEQTTDYCEDVSVGLENVVVKNS
jgi:uncharacterized protein